MSQTDFSPFSHEDSVPMQLDAIRLRLDEDREIYAGKFAFSERRMGDLERMVAENTVVSREAAKQAMHSAQTARMNADVLEDIRDAQVIGRSLVKAGRLLTRPVLWAGTIAGAGTAIYAAVYAFTHGGKMP